MDVSGLSAGFIAGVQPGHGAGTGSHGVVTSPASRKDAALFAQLMSPEQSAGATRAASGVAPVQNVAQSNLSNGLREGIKQAAEAYRARFENLNTGLKKMEKSPSISSLLQWQLESVKMGVEMEFTGKIASKLVQDIEQLTKQQG